MIVVEVTGSPDGVATQVFYLSTDPMTTRPTDTPQNRSFLPVLKDPGSIGTSAFGDGKTAGGTSLEIGEMSAVNMGKLDFLQDYGFDGRSIVIRQGNAGDAYPSAWAVLFKGTLDSLEFSWQRVVFRLRDKQFVFTADLQPLKFAGNNVLPNGAEGVAGDLKGKPKPITLGAPLNVAPPCVNTSKLTFQVNDGPVSDIAQVYDRGVALTKGADYASLTALEAASPSSSTYITCFALGLFRLGSAPTGIITCNPVEGATAADRTAAQLLKKLAIRAGVLSTDVSADDVAQLDADNNTPLGLWVNEESSVAAAMDQVAQSVGAYYGFDQFDKLRMARLTAPTGVPDATFTDVWYRKTLSIRAANDTGIPNWSVKVRYGKFWTVQTSDVAGSVTAARRAELREEYRTSPPSTNLSVKNKHLLSTEYTLDTLLSTEAAAVAEADRQLGLHGVRRTIVEITVPARAIPDNSLRLLRVVSLVSGRFGMSGGKLFRIIGMRLELGKNRATLVLWG